MRRFDGNLIHYDWHVGRVVAAIRSAAQDPEKPAIADSLAAAIAKQQARERVAARNRKRQELETACRHEEAAVVSGLEVELRTLLATDPGMSLLDAVEYATPDPDRRIALYGRCSADEPNFNGMGQDDPCLLKIAASVAKDLALLEHRANAEGFQV